MRLKLGDFGLAREAAPTDMLPVRREICTVWYRAPELIMGGPSYNSLIDVWSSGEGRRQGRRESTSPGI